MEKVKLIKKPLTLIVFLILLFIVSFSVGLGLITKLSPTPPINDGELMKSNDAKTSAAEKKEDLLSERPAEKFMPEEKPSKESPGEKMPGEELPMRERRLIEEAADNRAREYLDLGDKYELQDIFIRDTIADLRYESKEESVSMGVDMEEDTVFNFTRKLKEKEELPDRITKEEAKEKARKKVNRLYPNHLEEGTLDETPKVMLSPDREEGGSLSYSVFFQRLKNEVPVGNDGVNLTVKASKGEIVQLSKDFTRVDKFKSLDSKNIELKEAQTIFEESFPLQLIYNLEKKGFYYTFLGEMNSAATIRDNSLNYYLDTEKGDFYNWDFTRLDKEKIDNVLTESGKLKESYLEDITIELGDGQLIDPPEEINEKFIREVVFKTLDISGYSDGFEIKEIKTVEELNNPPPALEGKEMYEITLEHQEIDDDIEALSNAYVCKETGELVKLSIHPHILIHVEPTLGSETASILEGKRNDFEIGDVEKAVLSSFPIQKEYKLIPRNEINRLFLTSDALDVEPDEIPGTNGQNRRRGENLPNFNYVMIENGVPLSGSGFYILLDEFSGAPWEIIRVPPQLIREDLEKLHDSERALSLDEARKKLVSELEIKLSYELEPGGMYPQEDRVMTPVYQLKNLEFEGMFTPEVPYIDPESGKLLTREGSPYRER